MKKKVLQTIYNVFDQWAQDHSDELRPLCTKGCASCCTQNVTVTAMEAENILQHIIDNGEVEWFADALAEALNTRGYHASPTCTTNEFAQACFAGKELEMEEQTQMERCPFLSDDNLCKIYDVRPFGCRMFVSSTRCSKQQPAVLPEFYIDTATAANQLIEHLSQKEYWGNMLDVLAALLDLREYASIADRVAEHGAGISRTARMRILSCHPLPGFIVDEKNRKEVDSFLQQLFNQEIDGFSVEDILNGKK